MSFAVRRIERPVHVISLIDAGERNMIRWHTQPISLLRSIHVAFETAVMPGLNKMVREEVVRNTAIAGCDPAKANWIS